MTKLFFDESGFSGSDLLAGNQPVFAYGGVAISDAECRRIVEELRKSHRIQSAEVKGQLLLRRGRGRLAVKSLIGAVGGRARIVVCHKVFALCCKFADYIVEPVFYPRTQFFHAIRFGKLVALSLFAEARNGSADIKALLAAFQNSVRDLDVGVIREAIEELDGSDHLAPHLCDLVKIIKAGIDQVEREFHEISAMGEGARWVLDVTDASLHSLLAYWGERLTEFEVLCDKSKPLLAVRAFFNQLGEIKEKHFIDLGSRRRLVNPPIKGGLRLEDSKDFPGIQIADVLTSTATWCLRNMDDREAKELLTDLGPLLSGEDSIWPSPPANNDELRLFTVSKHLWSLLAHRASAGHPLVDDLEPEILMAQELATRELSRRTSKP